MLFSTVLSVLLISVFCSAKLSDSLSDSLPRTSSKIQSHVRQIPRGGSSSVPEPLADLVEETIASNRKIVVVTGGVLSGIGKGVTASSIGVLFRAMGLRVTALKIDPYLNVDAGTMSPFEHGEVFVLDDGGETDLDLGNYVRFLGVCLTRNSNLSTVWRRSARSVTS